MTYEEGLALIERVKTLPKGDEARKALIVQFWTDWPTVPRASEKVRLVEKAMHANMHLAKPALPCLLYLNPILKELTRGGPLPSTDQEETNRRIDDIAARLTVDSVLTWPPKPTKTR